MNHVVCNYNVDYAWGNVFENHSLPAKFVKCFPLTILTVINNTCTHDFVADG